MSSADDLERELDALEPMLERLREQIKQDSYGWGAERDLALERLDAGTAYLADARVLLTDWRALESRITQNEEKRDSYIAQIDRLDELPVKLAEELEG